ncbi:MAG: PAS domain S-box protein [Halorientalis sp.]
MRSGSDREIRVLHVDDEPDFADLAASFLEREDGRFAVETATSARAARERLAGSAFDCVVSDYDMPDKTGIELLESVRASDPDLPFILFTGKGSEEVASEAISAGVTDYLQKEGGTDQYAVLANRVANAVEHRRARREVERSERRLREVVDLLPHLLYVVDESGTYRLANEALADFHGTTVDALEGSTLDEVLDPAAAEQFRRHRDEVLSQDATVHASEVAVVGQDGEERVLDARLQPYEYGDGRSVLGVAVDVTEREERERALERTRERMRLALSHTNSVIFELDCDTGEVVRHGAYGEFFEVGTDQVPTWRDHLENAVHPEDRDAFARFYEQLIDGERDEGRLEYRTAPDLGEVRWIRDAVSVRAEGDGRQVVGVAHEVTAEKERERRLRRTERRFHALFDDPNILVALVDTDGTVLEVNETALGYVSATREAVVGTPFPETPWVERSDVDASVVRAWVDRAADGEYVPFDLAVGGSGDRPHALEGVFRPVTDADGAVVSLVVSARDVTDRRDRERELEQYRAYLEGSNDIVTVLDEDGVVRYQSPAVSRILGYGPDELLGEVGFDYVHPEDVEGLLATFADLVAEPDGRVTAEARFRTATGEWRWLEVRGRNLLDHPEVGGVITNNRDITERKAHEERLAALSQTTRELLAAESRDEVVRVGAEAARDVLETDAIAFYRHDADASVLEPAVVTDAGASLVDEVPSLPAGEGPAWESYADGEPAVVDDLDPDACLLGPDATLRSVLLLPVAEYGLLVAGSTESGAFDDRDVVIGETLAGSVATALEQVARTEQLRARERELTRQNDRLEEFAGVVSHDLRNPLQVAHGRVQLARAEADSEDLADAERALERMDDLIDDLLTLAREGDQVQEVAALDLRDVVERCWTMVDTADATLRVDGTRTVRADPGRLKQLFENLLGNAVEHGGPDVTVTVSPIEGGFAVADDGAGVPADRPEQVFEPGCTTTPDGTGFGLSIVQRIVEAHGWDVAVRESADGGARFEVTGLEPSEVGDGDAVGRG